MIIPLLLTSSVATAAVRQLGGQTELTGGTVTAVFAGGTLADFRDTATGEPLLACDPTAWYVEVGTQRAGPAGTPRLELVTAGETITAVIRQSVGPPEPIEAEIRVTAGPRPWLELSIAVTNRSRDEIEVIGFPAGARLQRGGGRHLVYPYQSGALLPLDERFGRMRIFGTLPFVHGYPSNLCAMQWLGAVGPQVAWMLQGTDRYGALTRTGAVESDGAAVLVWEHQAGLPPGETYAPPPLRLHSFPGGDWHDLAEAYRRWVTERRAEGATVVRDGERIPLQFVPFRAKLAARPQLAQVMTTHGYPEHAIREQPDGTPFAYLPYGLVLALQERFERLYDSPLTPQLWSPLVPGGHGWRLFPPSDLPAAAMQRDGVDAPGVDLAGFIQRQRAPVILYVNPSFWTEGTPDFDPAWMMDINGDGTPDTTGGFEAGAAGAPYYVHPYLVRDYFVAQLARLGQLGATGIMFDSSQVFGATLWNNSRLRRDAVSGIDRNPAARYLERYGYHGRDSFVQDKLGTYLALHEATPGAAKVGEWIGEFEPLFLDANAGSLDLKREYPDNRPRPGDDNLIPLPLFQMVYGDTELFVIRVGAASDAHLNDGGQPCSAEISRRATATFGAVGQVLFWGGIAWAGPAAELRGRTWQIVRDNVVRRETFAHRARHRLLDADGRPAPGMFAVRESSWIDDAGRVVGIHWDNNTGAPARAAGTLGDDQVTVTGLWGVPDYLPDSLERLRLGSTVTVTERGFTLWHYAGEVRRGDRLIARVADGAATPAGLSITLDGRYLSLGNESPAPRTVTLELPALRLTADPALGSPTPETAGAGELTRLTVTLPGAQTHPDDRPTAVPCAVAVYRVE